MKTIHLILLTLLLAGFCSCEKVIDINVRESDTRYVIEGTVTDEPGGSKVLVSRTLPFHHDNNFPPVGGALVTISDNGQERVLMETRPGVYESPSLTGRPGHRYELSVTIGSQVFTATSTMPQPVRLDTLYVAPGPFGQFRFATVAYSDPAGISNGYRFVQYVNGVKDPAIFWENDEFTDGRRVEVQLDTGVDRKDDPRNIKSGDTVLVEMQVLDQPVLHYWYSLRSGGGEGSGNAAAPSNPLTNIKGGALGYFSAHTVDRQSVVAL